MWLLLFWKSFLSGFWMFIFFYNGCSVLRSALILPFLTDFFQSPSEQNISLSWGIIWKYWYKRFWKKLQSILHLNLWPNSVAGIFLEDYLRWRSSDISILSHYQVNDKIIQRSLLVNSVKSASLGWAVK